MRPHPTTLLTPTLENEVPFACQEHSCVSCARGQRNATPPPHPPPHITHVRVPSPSHQLLPILPRPTYGTHSSASTIRVSTPPPQSPPKSVGRQQTLNRRHPSRSAEQRRSGAVPRGAPKEARASHSQQSHTRGKKTPTRLAFFCSFFYFCFACVLFSSLVCSSSVYLRCTFRTTNSQVHWACPAISSTA